jgi:hypothetical protein
MGTYDDEAPRLSEIVRMLNNMDRKFDDFRNQVQQQLNDKVSKERYEPEKTFILDKINTLDAKFTNIEARSRVILTTVWSALGSLAVGGILLYLGSR